MIEVRDGQTAHVDLFYPRADKAGLGDSAVRISLCHVRAANHITVRFDFERNGWAIFMDKTKELDDGQACETVEENCEVAFVPAWNEGE